jgi:hypothetical protein
MIRHLYARKIGVKLDPSEKGEYRGSSRSGMRRNLKAIKVGSNKTYYGSPRPKQRRRTRHLTEPRKGRDLCGLGENRPP